MRRRVLILAYFFPPLGGAGVQRTLKFVKYLPEYGWDPIVLTTDSRAYPAADESLARDIPTGVPVIRAHETGAFRSLARAAARIPIPHVTAPFAWPDETVGWLPGAVTAALGAIRRHSPAVVYSTSSPYCAHLAGLTVARLRRLPWVLDFRDEWSLNPYLSDLPWPIASANRLMEQMVIARATRVIQAADYFQFAGGNDAITLPNGVDEEDFRGDPPSVVKDRFRIAYVGTLYGKRDAAPVLAALSRLVDLGRVDADRLELRAVGNLWNQPTVPRGVHVTTTGYVPHAEAIGEMRSASALLLYEPPGSLATTGKVFEYLASGRPVLCVAPPENRAAQLIEELGAGVVASPDAPAEIDRAVERLYRQWADGDLRDQPGVRAAVVERFSRRRLTGQLAAVLDDAAASAGCLAGDPQEVGAQERQRVQE
jgi:glycosyltransferase involved in cell wall biosynthesis